MVKTWESENLVIPTSITSIKGKLTVGVVVFLVRIYVRSMNAAPSYAGRHSRRGAIMAAMDFFNQEPVVHTWTHKLDKAEIGLGRRC